MLPDPYMLLEPYLLLVPNLLLHPYLQLEPLFEQAWQCGVQAREFEWHEKHKHVVVQSYKANQLQVHKRRFYIRSLSLTHLCYTYIGF